jgi:hypothetical protein
MLHFQLDTLKKTSRKPHVRFGDHLLVESEIIVLSGEGNGLGIETFAKRSILFKVKKGENFNHRNTLSILRIKI